jgi:RIO kinase 1
LFRDEARAFVCAVHRQYAAPACRAFQGTLPVHFDIVSEAIEPLIDDKLIEDVLFPVKSGKEATLYCCRGGPRANADRVAVKVYKPVQFRSFRNDSVYQEGRVILDERSARASAKRTRHGRQVQAALWTNSEFATLRVLYRSGASVPRPLGQSAGAIAMEWIGDADTPAPQLKDVRLEPEEARVAFDLLVAEVELWLACNIVHGDLSAYNVLWDGARVVAIDFPQASDPRFNTSAERLLYRDIANICRHFARWGVASEPTTLTLDLWERFMRGEL